MKKLQKNWVSVFLFFFNYLSIINIYIFFFITGNRTVQQVASRMQKYAKKLKKAGIDSNEYYIKTTSKVKKSKKIMNKPTTFFPFNNDFNEIREDSVHEESVSL